MGFEIVFGAVVIFVDSRKSLPTFVHLGNDRGYHSPATKDRPAQIVVDINPEKRKTDNVDVKTSLVHELRHHLFDIFRRLMIEDPHIPITSATLNIYSPELPKNISSVEDLIVRDKNIYSLLLDRKITSEDIYNIKLQRAYLDELHSSIMQRKENWFLWNQKVYSTERKGFHYDLVGNDPKDIAHAKDLFCYLQGFFMLDKIARAAKDPNNPWSKKVGPKFKARIPQYFDFAGTLLATSLTVSQANRLLEHLWQKLLKEFPKIDVNLIFSGLTSEQKGKPANGQTIELFLAQKKG